MDGGVISKSYTTKDSVESASVQFADVFEGAEDKSSYNVFSQNSWYVGSKLAPIASKTSLKKLIDIQLNLTKAFQDLMIRDSDEQVMRDFFVLSMSGNLS